MQYESNCHEAAACVNRRGFLSATGLGTATVLLGDLFPGRVAAQDEKQPANVTKLPRVKVGEVSQLAAGKPVLFSYPQAGGEKNCLLVKLGTAAGGGVGDEKDIVAFSTTCTHMGEDLAETFNAEHKLAGPCPGHLTTFDLTRHGMVAAGHATEALPQIVLEVEGDEIHATAVLGLVYGYSDNTQMLG